VAAATPAQTRNDNPGVCPMNLHQYPHFLPAHNQSARLVMELVCHAELEAWREAHKSYMELKYNTRQQFGHNINGNQLALSQRWQTMAECFNRLQAAYHAALFIDDRERERKVSALPLPS
jgi:hypothetical protein